MSEQKRPGPIRRVIYQAKGEKGVCIGKVWARTFPNGDPAPDDVQFYTEDARPCLRRYFNKDGFIKEYPVDDKHKPSGRPPADQQEDPFTTPGADDGIPF